MSDQQSDQQIIDRLNDLGAAFREQPSVRDQVLRRIRTEHARRASSPSFTHRWWGIAAMLAACVGTMAVGLYMLTGIRASEAFAAAIDQVAKAHTFSCRQIIADVDEKGKVEVHEMIYMFKEPDRSRMERRGGPIDGEVTITDYTKKRRLGINPRDKVADIQDTSEMYAVDNKTGDLVPIHLDTEVRDDVMKLTAEAVKDLGVKDLNGKKVRVLQSRGKESVRTVYVDPQTHQPVQIVIEWPQNPKSKFTYTDIRIDQELDDKLFNLDVPEGYKLFKGGPYVPPKAYYSKMMTKMRSLDMALILWSNDHGGKYPKELKELVGSNDMTAEKLAKLVSSPDKPNAPPAILYRPPRKNDANEIILYESPDQRRDGNVVAAMLDGHAEVATQAYFDKLMK